MLFRKWLIGLTVGLLAVGGSGCAKKKKALVQLERGSFTIQLQDKESPKTADNFRTLVKKNFYDGLTFHRVEPGFVVQGGDPKGDGTGGPAFDLADKYGIEIANKIKEGDTKPEFYTVQAEIGSAKHVEGTVGMARQPDMVNPKKESNGSQFYICLSPQPHLDGQYTVLGQVVDGMDVVKAIQRGDKIKDIKLK